MNKREIIIEYLLDTILYGVVDDNGAPVGMLYEDINEAQRVCIPAWSIKKYVVSPNIEEV